MSLVLSQLRWPSLAQDLAVMTVPGTPLTDIAQIYATYNITEQDLRNIIKIPEFQKLFKKEQEKCKAEGSQAGVVYRFSALSQSLSEKLFRDAMDSAMDSKDAIKLLELLMKAARLLDSKDAPQVNTQVNVAIPLALPTGLKNTKLAHMAKLSAKTVGA